MTAETNLFQSVPVVASVSPHLEKSGKVTMQISLDRKRKAMLPISQNGCWEKYRFFYKSCCSGAAPSGGIIGNPVRIGSGPATVSSDDSLYGLGKLMPILQVPGSEMPATVVTMGRRGRRNELQARRPARISSALSSTVKKAEGVGLIRIIKTFNPRSYV